MHFAMARENWWRLNTLDIPRSTLKDMQMSVESWVKNSGVDWAISRLKSLKIDLIRHQADLPPLSFIARNRNGGLKGWIGTMFRISRKSQRHFGHCIQAFMSYTMFIHPSITDGQWRKFQTSVESKESWIPPDLTDSVVKTAKECIGQDTQTFFTEHQSLLFYRGSESKKAPVLSGSSVKQNEAYERELDVFSYPMGRSLYRKHQNNFCFVLRDLDRAKMRIGAESQHQGVPDFDRSQVIAGNIGFIQEPGGKLRSVANPFRVYQQVLKPLGDRLFRILKDLPWDCTFDQTKALPVIQSALKKRQTVHCVDLSAATDYFPLSLQLSVLKGLFGNQELIDLFEDLSRASWRTNMKEKPLIRWSRGQPMGLYPSFASFGLTHGLLLLTLAKGQYHGQFFVVGDDVVILDDGLAEAYQRVLNLLECPFSPDKTISTSVLAEFAGKIITKDMIIPQLKWRKPSDNNFIDVMKLVGQRARPILTRRQRRVYDVIKEWMEPFGCNHSSHSSKPLSKVVEESLIAVDRLFSDKKGRDSLVDLSHQLRKDHFGEDKLWKDLNTRSVLKTISTFDEKVARTFSSTIFGKAVEKDIMTAKLFADIVEGKDYSCLPLVEKSPSVTTTLDWYERKLNIN